MGTSPKTLRRWFKFCLMIPVPNEEPRVWLDPEVFVQPLEWISRERFNYPRVARMEEFPQ